MDQYLPWIIAAAVAVGAWVGARALMRHSQAKAAEAVVGARFADFMFEVLVNAARIDGRLDVAEREAIAQSMSEANGAPFDRAAVDAGLSRARLAKDDLVAYLAENGRGFSMPQKCALLKGVLSVAMADGKFDQREHDIYIDYIEAIGFERVSAPQMFQDLVGKAARGNIV
jgi:uncharacterized membrane protein YebE (DUF533 family)